MGGLAGHVTKTRFPSPILAGWPRGQEQEPGLAEGVKAGGSHQHGLGSRRGLVSQGCCKSWNLINNGDSLIMETL